jgi:4-amino-4-deoxy-L-arabinose transferase-like glycosyltransferase
MNAWLRRHRAPVIVFLLAVIWFLPALWWGLPIRNAKETMVAWAVDELGPWGAANAVLAIVGRPLYDVTPQYPLGHFLVQAIFVWPYYLPHYLATMYPNAAAKVGIAMPPVSLAVMTLLHRLPSLLMAAGTVAVAYASVRRLAGNAAGLLAAAAVATIGPLMYYARTSNTDAGALFWTALAVAFALPALREGLTVRRAVAVSLCAAIGTATKDQQYAFFLGLGLVLLCAHLDDCRRERDWTGWWHAPLAGVAAGALAYLGISGVVLLPEFFKGHVRFITRVPDPAIPQEILTFADAYHSTAATPEGYAQLATNIGAQLVAAIGLPILLLAAAGVVYAARTDRRLLGFLLVPLACLVLGVIVPVRLVLPRYLLPVDFMICVAAGVAFAQARTLGKAQRVMLWTIAAIGVAWNGLRGVDLTYQMLRDSRYEAGAWLERNLQQGDVVGYYGGRVKLPRLPTGIVLTPAAGQLELHYRQRPMTTTAAPAFIISIPQLSTESVHEWTVHPATFARLLDPESDYELVLAIQTPALWPRPLLVASFVNPQVRVFARKDIVPRLREPVRIELPDPR